MQAIQSTPLVLDSREDPARKDVKRAYKACLHCRKSKTKCELGPEPRVCLKCAREHRECCFPEQRSVRRKKARPNSTSATNISLQIDDNTRAESLSDLPHAYDPPIELRDLDGIANTITPLHRSSVPRGHVSHDDHIISSRNADDRHESSATLQTDVVRTVVSTANDARSLLFAAAEQQDTDDSEDQPVCVMSVGRPSPASLVTSSTKLFLPVVSLSRVTNEDMALWSQHRFVRQAWFTAQEAVTYIDLFFKNLGGLSPAVDFFFADHRNHKQLIIGEPLLCSTLLMISSRFHILPGYGSPSRAEFIHLRLWKYCEHLIYRITFGAEKYCTAKTRTYSSIQALLLMTEWHPRALRFPPEGDGWDPSLAPGIDDSYGHPHGNEDPNSIRWREEVFEPAKRSDRMSWTIIGLAVTIAHELGVFEDANDDVGAAEISKRIRLRRLLYLYVHQLTLRLGCTSIFPPTCQVPVSIQDITLTPQGQAAHDRDIILSQYLSITKLLKTASDMFFPSKSMTRQIIKSGKYLTLLEHFIPLLSDWHKEFVALELPTTPEVSKQLLLLEYYHANMYINSIGIQAAIERISDGGSYGMPMDISGIITDQPQDLKFNSAVRDASCNVLSIAAKLGESGDLRYCPVRLFVRVVVASVYLLKSLSLGAKQNDILYSLKVLDECKQALREQNQDDVHLSTQFGTLIARLVRRFKRNLRAHTGLTMSKAVTPDPLDVQSHPRLPTFQQDLTTDMANNDKFDGGDLNNFSFGTEVDVDAWLAQPFDPSLAPFGIEATVGATNLDPKSLDFFWNLPL